MSTKRIKKEKKGLTYVIILVTSLIFVFPFYWMVSTALKSTGNVYVLPPQWIPNPVQLHNFVDIYSIFPFFLYIRNNVYSCTLSAFGQTLCSSLAAYAFTRIRWPGRNIFFIVTISTMMIPFGVFAVPWYMLYRQLGLLGTLAPLWLPYWFQHPYIIFLLAVFFRSIPNSLSDAARIDGCSHFCIYLRIILPLSKNALLTAFLLHFIFMWKNLLVPLMYINKSELFTLSIGLQNLLGGTIKPSSEQLMAASLIASLPLVILFIIFNKYIMTGIAISSWKS